MNAHVSTQDLQRLSAYLDGALKPGEARRVEARLQQEPQLASALQQLSATRNLLRRAPRRRAPRNFILTPAMAGDRKGTAGWANWSGWSLVSAGASLLLVVTLLGSLWANPPALMAAAPALEAMSAPMADMATKEGETDAEVPEDAAGAEMLESAETGEAGAAEDSGELEMFSVPADEQRTALQEPAAFDLRFFLLENGVWIELALALIAGTAGLAAWRQRRWR